MKRTLARILPMMFVGLVALLPTIARSSASPQAQAVLAQEHRWLVAIAKGDAKALGAVLADDFVHVTYRGAVRYRSDELADVVKKKPYTQRTGEQTVNFAGPSVAIASGVNTVSQSGRVVMRLRYTDVYQKIGGNWLAVWAQETLITAP
jgi:hypothetical protein